MSTLTLQEIADRMTENAVKEPWAPGEPVQPYTWQLARGLVVRFTIDSQTQEHQLDMLRKKVQPSDMEIRLVTRAFHAPDHAERTIIVQQTGSQWHCTRLTWGKSYPQPTVIDVQAPASHDPA